MTTGGSDHAGLRARVPGWRGPSVLGGVLLIVVAAGLLAVAAGVLVPSTPVAGPAPHFMDETVAAGVAFTYDGPFEFATGAGVAVLDCDEDGRPDVYLAGGANPAALYRNASAPSALHFERVADPATDLTGVNGAYPIDLDSDGHPDLVVLRSGENVVLRGLGDCRFERADEGWGIASGNESTQAFAATWEPDQSWPTLAFGNYVDFTSHDPGTWCQANELVRPRPPIRPPPIGSDPPLRLPYSPPIPLRPSWCTLSMLFSDWDGSGRRDLRVSNDLHYYPAATGEEQLWKIEPGNPPHLYTAAEGWNRVQIQGMGIASYDLDGDGLPEVYLTSQSANKLQTLGAGPSKPTYVDIGLKHGVNVAHPFAGDVNLPSTAWHPEFADINDDGWIDLFVSKGNVTSQPDFAIRDPSNLLLGQPDGTFREAAELAGIVDFERGRGAALVDLDLDGRLDLVESFYGAPVRVWRNEGPADATAAASAHWLALRVAQPAPNVDAIGAWLEVRSGARTWRRELVVGGGHAGGQLGWVHLGLGPATSVEVRVTWPDGEVGPWQPVAVDAFAIVSRSAGTVQPWTPVP